MRGLIIVAACDEESSLVKFLPRLNQSIKELPDRYLFSTVLIDDGSKDGTARVAKDNGCSVIRNESNKGLGASLRIGYEEAAKRGVDVAVTLDADGQHKPEFLPKLLQEFERGADLVIGARYHEDSERQGVPFDRDMLNMQVRAHLRVVTGWKLSDPLSGFRAMNSRMIEFMAKETTFPRYGTCLENLVKLWYLMDPRPKIVEVAHPAIYEDLEGRVYSDSNVDQRIQRFAIHAKNIHDALEEVKRRRNPENVEREIEARRKEWCATDQEEPRRVKIAIPAS